MTTEKTPAAWSAVTAQWAAWRAAYLAEVERFAETLRPRFASGELRAERSPEDDQERIPGTTGWGDECFTHDPTPEEVIERLVEEHFGIAVTKTPDAHGGVVFDGDASAAHLILAVSPHSEATEDHVDFWVHNDGVMPRDVQLQVFQRSFSTKGPGRGLGTYSIKLLTERYLHGRASFTSTPETGTTFSVTYPRNQDDRP